MTQTATREGELMAPAARQQQQPDLSQDPHVREILVALVRAREPLLRAPTTSNGRRAIEAHLLAAGRLLGMRVGDRPTLAEAEAALTHARQAMQRQLVMATQLLDEPIARIRTLWNLPTLPETLAREIGTQLRDTARDALLVLDRNAPLIASTWGSAVQGLGMGAIVAFGVIAWMLLKK